MRPSADETMMAIAQVLALRGTCIKKLVGCVLTDKRGRILAAAYNGVPIGMPHCNEEAQEGRDYKPWGKPVDGERLMQASRMVTVFPNACNGGKPFAHGADLCEAVHAEQNALLQCKDPDAVRSVYVTAQPCMRCAKMLLNTGARRLLFAEAYPQEPQALQLWARAGREYHMLIQGKAAQETAAQRAACIAPAPQPGKR